MYNIEVVQYIVQGKNLCETRRYGLYGDVAVVYNAEI